MLFAFLSGIGEAAGDLFHAPLPLPLACLEQQLGHSQDPALMGKVLGEMAKMRLVVMGLDGANGAGHD